MGRNGVGRCSSYCCVTEADDSKAALPTPGARYPSGQASGQRGRSDPPVGGQGVKEWLNR